MRATPNTSPLRLIQEWFSANQKRIFFFLTIALALLAIAAVIGAPIAFIPAVGAITAGALTASLFMFLALCAALAGLFIPGKTGQVVPLSGQFDQSHEAAPANASAAQASAAVASQQAMFQGSVINGHSVHAGAAAPASAAAAQTLAHAQEAADAADPSAVQASAPAQVAIGQATFQGSATNVHAVPAVSIGAVAPASTLAAQTPAHAASPVTASQASATNSHVAPAVHTGSAAPASTLAAPAHAGSPASASQASTTNDHAAPAGAGADKRKSEKFDFNAIGDTPPPLPESPLTPVPSRLGSGHKYEGHMRHPALRNPRTNTASTPASADRATPPVSPAVPSPTGGELKTPERGRGAAGSRDTLTVPAPVTARATTAPIHNSTDNEGKPGADGSPPAAQRERPRAGSAF